MSNYIAVVIIISFIISIIGIGYFLVKLENEKQNDI